MAAGRLSATAPDDQSASLEGLRAADVAVGSVLYRLAVANDELCLKRAALTGLVLHSSNDYADSIRAAAIRHFDFESPIGIEGVIPGSPAAVAGIQSDDSLISVGGRPISASTDRADALAMLDAADPRQPLAITVKRHGQLLSVTLRPIEGCVAHVEVDVSDGLNAGTDGETIQVDSALVNLVGGNVQDLAVILSHELSHIVLDHPHRLTAAHVDRGFFRIFGKSGRLIKETENQADRLSVTLMANAGYDPQEAVHYWRTFGPRLNDGGGLGSVHLPWQQRADLIAAAVAAIPADAAKPIVPRWIESRKQPLR
nr:M48 family metallopeptidase [Hephaestia mangrovi]